MSSNNTWFGQSRIVQYDLTRALAMIARMYDQAASLLKAETAPNPTITDQRLQRLPLSMFTECATQLQTALGQMIRSAHYRGFLLTAEHLDLVQIAAVDPYEFIDVRELVEAAVHAVKARDYKPLVKVLRDAQLITEQEASA